MPSASKKYAKTALAVAALLGMGSAAIAQNVIVRSTGPSAATYPKGKKLGNTETLRLKRSDKVTVLSSKGTRVFTGPGNYSLASSARSGNSASTRIASFISSRSNRRARTGAVRGAGTDAVATPAPGNPNLWYLDIRDGGNFCVANPSAVVMWRPDYTGSATASVVNPTNGQITQVQWRKGNPLKAWPGTDAPVTDGATYQLQGSGLPSQHQVTFKTLPSVSNDAAELAAALIERDCSAQVDRLTDQFVVETQGADGSDAG